MIKVLQVTNEDTGVKFNVRLLEQGEAWGADDKLRYEEEEPAIEFYDARYPHTILGQFITRYNIRSIAEHRGELLLYADVKAWRITRANIEEIVDWLEEIVKKRVYKVMYDWHDEDGHATYGITEEYWTRQEAEQAMENLKAVGSAEYIELFLPEEY